MVTKTPMNVNPLQDFLDYSSYDCGSLDFVLSVLLLITSWWNLLMHGIVLCWNNMNILFSSMHRFPKIKGKYGLTFLFRQPCPIPSHHNQKKGKFSDRGCLADFDSKDLRIDSRGFSHVTNCTNFDMTYTIRETLQLSNSLKPTPL